LRDGAGRQLEPNHALGCRAAVSDFALAAEGLELDRRSDRRCELGEQVDFVSRPGSSARVEDAEAADGVSAAPENRRGDERTSLEVADGGMTLGPGFDGCVGDLDERRDHRTELTRRAQDSADRGADGRGSRRASKAQPTFVDQGEKRSCRASEPRGEPRRPFEEVTAQSVG
jgi:hypothetical protein